MKKLFFGAIAAMTLAACSQEDIDNSSTSKEVKKVNGIEYSVSARNQTRVTDSYSSTNLPGSFKVWAVKASDNSDFITGETITGTDGTYAGTTEHEWDGNSYNFFASVNGDITVTEGKAAISGFTVEATAASQVDLLYASEPSKSSGSVNIAFKHALSQVCFKAKNTNSKISVKINSVGIGYLNNKGTYTLPSTSTYTGTATGEWSDLSGTAEYTVSLGDEGVTLTGEAKALTSGTTSSILAVIPQKQSKLTVANGATSVEKNGAYFILNADVTSTDNTSENEYSGNIYVPVSIDWAEGTRYIYTLTFADGDGGYRDNGSTVIGGGTATTYVGYTVSCADYVDKTNDSEMTTATTLTLNPTADTYVRVGNTTDNSSAATMEIVDKTFTKSGETTETTVKMYGLMQFSIPEAVITNAATIKSAKLYLVSERNKGAKAVSIYSIDTYGTKYADIETNITASLAKTAIISEQALNGQSGKAVTDKDITVGTYDVVSAWTNEFDLTSYIKTLTEAGDMNLLLSSSAITADESFKFYTSEATDVTNTNVTPNFTFSADDLKPKLVIVYQ